MICFQEPHGWLVDLVNQVSHLNSIVGCAPSRIAPKKFSMPYLPFVHSTSTCQFRCNTCIWRSIVFHVHLRWHMWLFCTHAQTPKLQCAVNNRTTSTPGRDNAEVNRNLRIIPYFKHCIQFYWPGRCKLCHSASRGFRICQQYAWCESHVSDLQLCDGVGKYHVYQIFTFFWMWPVWKYPVSFF